MKKDKTCAGGGALRLAAVLLLAAVMAFVLAACSSGGSSGDTATQTDAEEDTVTSGEEDTLQDKEEPADEAGGDVEDDTAEDDTAEDAEQTDEASEPETTTRDAADVGTKVLADGIVTVDGYEASMHLPLPEGWEEYELDDEIIYVSEDYPLSVPNISIYAAENDGSLAYTTKEIVEAVCEETFADMSFTMGEFENTTISGCNAVLYSYSIVTGETEITQYYVLVETELTLFRVTFTDSGDAYGEVFKACMDQITVS